MTREQLKAILPEGADDSAVTKILDALHAEIQPHKDAAKQTADDLAAKVAEMAEISKTAATASEKAKAYDELQAKYDADIKAANDAGICSIWFNPRRQSRTGEIVPDYEVTSFNEILEILKRIVDK